MSVLRETGPIALSERVYEEVEQAVMESSKGRWFLSEYAKRSRARDTQSLLDAIARLESAIGRSGDTVPTHDEERFFAQDQDLFEPLDKPPDPQAAVKTVGPEAVGSAEARAGQERPRIVVVHKPSSQDVRIPLMPDSHDGAVA